ncbi:PEP-CTERM sorting domain-containing protein [Candidatus Falkowbacteria bacterium]|nr:PEP-CTERM sorting domain-containing protein [Candidatus Falkowbacteria bacterium]
MRKILVSVIVLAILSTGTAFALPWTQTFAQVSVEPFNFVEGFILSGQRFSTASPENGINFDGIGNILNPGWHGDRPNQNYVRAWGSSDNYLVWDSVFDGRTYEGSPLGISIFWFFYNTPSIDAPPQGQINLLTFQTNYYNGSWQMYSSIHENSFGPIPNMYASDMVDYRAEDFAELRGEWTVPTDQSAPVPEPATSVLLGIGLASLAIYGKRRQNRNQLAATSI